MLQCSLMYQRYRDGMFRIRKGVPASPTTIRSAKYEMSIIKKLHSAKTIADVADILGFQKQSLSFILYVQSDSLKYKEFDIPKRSGGLRRIAAPKGGLKLLQRRLADLLQDCLDEIDNNTCLKSNADDCDQVSHGFRRRLSILTNAKKHRNRRYVFNIDLADFFGSINFGRVRGFFIKDRRFHLDPKVATIFAQIACFKQSLPQGSPCSPIISNLIGNILDVHMTRLAIRSGCMYTRYADDLTFSTNKRCFPESIAKRNEDAHNTWIPGSELLELVNRSGFSINPQKTRMQYNISRQEVTGLVVNKKVNVKYEYRHNVRAMVHRLTTKGDFLLPEYIKDESNAYSLAMKSGSLNQLHGRLGFIDSIDRYNAEIEINSQSDKDEIKRKEAEIKRKEAIYRRFLFYKEFYAATKPVLICEGWTDVVYIENALRRLAPKYPSLVSLVGEKANFAIKRFRHSGSRTGKILGITGGTAPLGNFVKEYKKEFERFSVPGMREPVIILLDNDTAGNKVFKDACNHFKVKTNKSDPYILHAYRNLYLILIPLQDDKSEAQIEDLFDASTLDIKIEGKPFNLSNKEGTELTHSKAVFAREVVEKMTHLINFDGFAPLLDQIVKVIEIHYAQRKR